MSRNKRGYVLIFVLIFFGIFMVLSSSLVSYSSITARNEKSTVRKEQALAIAEAGIEKAVYELNQNASFAGESNVALGAGTFTTTITSVNGNTKRITSTAYIPNSASPLATRAIKADVSINNQVVSFRYGVQVGSGGFTLNGGAQVNGSIYSNGNITATNGSTITGSAIAANLIATTTDQANDAPTPISSCTSSTCVTFANASATEDFSQSFQITQAVGLNSVDLYIKKVGTPANATVRIVNDASGSPGTDVLMTGTLNASAVTTNFGWVSVPLPSTPVLDPGQTYWIVIDAASNASRYYIIGANSAYGNGTGKIGRYGSSWSNTTPSGLDGYFKLYLGGGTSMIGGDTYIGGVQIGSGSDEAWAHKVQGASVQGSLYCQIGSFNNKVCNTSRADPTPAAMPLSDNNIQDWKDDAAAGVVTTGDVTVGWAGATTGPRKIVGNLTVNGGGTLTLTGTLWVTGNLTVTGGGKVRLDASYGANSGVIVVDGRATINGGATFNGSGTAGSYPFLISTNACPAAPGCNGEYAISLSGGAGTVALVAQDGTVSINGGSALKAVTAKQVIMTGGAELTYDSGLISENFYSGPGGSWAFVPGTYVITQ